MMKRSWFKRMESEIIWGSMRASQVHWGWRAEDSTELGRLKQQGPVRDRLTLIGPGTGKKDGCRRAKAAVEAGMWRGLLDAAMSAWADF